MIKIAVCDDENEELNRYDEYMSTLPSNTCTYDLFQNSNDLLKYRECNNTNFDIYILDIVMDQMDGLALAREIRKFDHLALIIFVTNYPNYVYDVFDVITFNFIQKPLTLESFQNIIHKAFNFFQITNRNFVFKKGRNIITLPCTEIYYIEKNDRKALIHTTNATYDCYISTSKILQQVGDTFVQIHGSIVVNLKYVQSVINNEVLLTTGIRLYCSRSFNNAVKKKHLSYLRTLL